METKALARKKKTANGKTGGKNEIVPKNKAGDTKKIAAGYNQYKFYDGQQYTGMKVGRTHKWYYDKGEWKEKKMTPDRWEFSYVSVKRRAGKAPEGSGVPVGTGFHWFILAHQFAEKLNADDYLTTMTGLKIKLAHKRVGKGAWNASSNTQVKNLVKILRQLIDELEKEPEKSTPVPLNFEYKGKTYIGDGMPVISSCEDGVCKELDITLNKEHLGIIRCTEKGWRMNDVKGQGLVNAIGEHVFDWYE
jgi:hypothetical protein